MGMSEMTLYFNFSPKLMLNLGLLQLTLEEYFQSNDMITLHQSHISHLNEHMKTTRQRKTEKPAAQIKTIILLI